MVLAQVFKSALDEICRFLKRAWRGDGCRQGVVLAQGITCRLRSM